MSENMENTETEVQETVETQTTEERTYSQKEFDAAMAGVRRTQEDRFARKYENIDVDEYRVLKAEKEAAEIERAKERGEFDKAFQDGMAKKNAEIEQLRKTITTMKVDEALQNEAMKHNAVNVNQMVALLKGNVKLNDSGEAEVLDESGAVRYTDDGTPMAISDYVKEFATANPHFIRASQGGTGSQGAAGGSTQKPQSVADMLSNWENGGRAAFAAMKGKR